MTEKEEWYVAWVTEDIYKFCQRMVCGFRHTHTQKLGVSSASASF